MATITERILRAFGINKTEQEATALLGRLESKPNDGLYHINNAMMGVSSWKMDHNPDSPENQSAFWQSNHQDITCTIGDVVNVVAIGISSYGNEFKDGKGIPTGIMAHVCDDKGHFYQSQDPSTVAGFISLMCRMKYTIPTHPVAITIGRDCDSYRVYNVTD